MRIAYVCLLFSVLCVTFVGVGANPSIFTPDIGGFLNSIPNILDPQAQLKKVWQEVEKNGPQVAEQLFGQITKAHAEITPIIDDFRDSINKAIDQARKAHDEIQKAIAGKGITMEDISTLLSREVEKIHEDLKDVVDDPLPEGHDRRSKVSRDGDRARFISQVMEKIGIAYVRVLTEVGVPREVAETQINEFSSVMTRILLIAGRIIDKYPFLLDIIFFILSMLLLPQLPLLRPILRLFGFGPLGPVKGSVAAWAQRVFWGGAVSPGSIFAILQRLGMTAAGSLLEKFLASAGLAAIFGHRTSGQQDL